MSTPHDNSDDINREDAGLADSESAVDPAAQAILDQAAAERAAMHDAAAARLGDGEPRRKPSRWVRLRDELLDPSWKTIITVLTTSGLSLAVGLVLVYTGR